MSEKSQPIIRLTGVGMEWKRNTALHDIDLTINDGDFIAITGPNGGGKTTLLRIILKLLKPSTGGVTYYDPEGNQVKDLSIGYLPQKNLIDSRFPITVREVVESGLTKSHLKAEEKKALVDITLDTIELRDKADSVIGNLSGGQLQRTLLGRAIISKPRVLVLDEPLSYIDKHFEQRIYNIIADIASRATIILVSHEMSTIASMANRHIIVDRNIHECSAAHHMVYYDCDK